jgi:hypothetical protein
MTKEELCKHIEASFSDAPKPAGGALSLPTYDDEGTNEFFSGTDWRSHSVCGLRRHDFALTVFTPSAFRYYLPAFLLCSIRDPEKADIIPEAIVSGLRRDVSGNCQRITTLSARERSAVARFLEWLRDEHWQLSQAECDELTFLVHALGKNDSHA